MEKRREKITIFFESGGFTPLNKAVDPVRYDELSNPVRNKFLSGANGVDPVRYDELSNGVDEIGGNKSIAVGGFQPEADPPCLRRQALTEKPPISDTNLIPPLAGRGINSPQLAAFRFVRELIPRSLLRGSSSGFTLIELLVSISIVALISGVFLANYHSTNKRSELIMAAQKLVSDIRLAQSYSLGSKEYGSEIPAGGWGAHFDKSSSPTSYKIFADSNGDKKYNVGEDDKSQGGQTINLPAGIKIEEINVGRLLDSVAITFLPPDPTTNIWDGLNDYNIIQIKLREESGNSTKIVEVNFFGLIDVRD